MEKNVISQSDELIKLRNSFKKNNIIKAFFVGFFVVLLWLIYVTMYALSQGNYMGYIFVPYFSYLKGMPYFDLSGYIFDFTNMQNIYRCIAFCVVLIVGLIVAVIYSHFEKIRQNKRYKNKYFKYVIAEAKINGIVIDEVEDTASLEQVSRDLDLMNISLPEKEKAYQFSTPMLSWIGSQYTYTNEDVKRDGFLITTDLSKAKTQGLIQIRTFGKVSIKQYEGLDISKYGFGEDNRISNFVCYTSLGPDIYLAINSKVADALADLKNFVQADVIVMVTGNKLRIFIDGFRLNLSHNIKDKIRNDMLEKQAEAIVAFHQVITSLSVAFSGEVSFASEGKGNGISSY